MTFPKTYKTRDGSKAIIEHEVGEYITGKIILGNAEISTAWSAKLLNSCEKPEWDLMECEKERETY